MLLPDWGRRKDEGPIEMYPKARLDALTDGLFYSMSACQTIFIRAIMVPCLRP
jgi:hypothetical protein